MAQQLQGQSGKAQSESKVNVHVLYSPHALCAQAACPHCRLTNHGLEAPVSDVNFEASDERAAGKVLQRLRSEEAADGSTATKASGQQIAQDRLDVERVQGDSLKDHTDASIFGSAASTGALLCRSHQDCTVKSVSLCFALKDQSSQRVTASAYCENS